MHRPVGLAADGRAVVVVPSSVEAQNSAHASGPGRDFPDAGSQLEAASYRERCPLWAMTVWAPTKMEARRQNFIGCK